MSKRRENAVISVGLVASALEEAAADVPVATSLPRPAVKLEEAVALQLSFKHLLRIENLGMLKSLRKLQLDNNSISKIENLDSLVNLEWLDLSFNRIKKIEGLDSLTRLRDLSLFANEITAAEGLDALTSLQCLSLGNNLIAGIDSALYFRRLPALEALALEGNPLCKPAEGSRVSYAVFCHAFLPKIKYLDFRMVTSAERASARDGGVPVEKLGEVEEKSAVEDRDALAASERAALVASLYAANLEMAVTFPAELFDDEPEFCKLRAMGMPGLEPMVRALGETLSGPASTLRDLGGDKDTRIRDEIAMFEAALGETVATNGAESAAVVDAWNTALKHATRDVSKGKIAGEAAVLAAVDALVSSAESMADELSRKEMSAHEMAEAMLDVLDSAMVELKAAKLVQHDAFFRALEAAVALFAEGMQKHAEKLVSDSDAGRLPPGLDDELQALLSDREALLGVVGQSAEARVGRVLKREAELRLREEKRCNGSVLAARAAELARHRARMTEIRALATAAANRAKEDLPAAMGEEDA